MADGSFRGRILVGGTPVDYASVWVNSSSTGDLDRTLHVVVVCSLKANDEVTADAHILGAGTWTGDATEAALTAIKISEDAPA